MQENKGKIDPDIVCNRALQAKMGVYTAKENFESALRDYNQTVDILINTVSLMKQRILELEKNEKEQIQ